MVDTEVEQRILCCVCGTGIAPNPAAMCLPCITAKTDISESIPKQCTLLFCRQCSRYLQPPNQWLPMELESRELLAMCLRRLRGITKVHVVDASFLWTEPHSKRIKVKLTIQKEVFANTVLQQWFVVDYVVAGQQCTDCTRVNSNQTWRAVAQVRQKVEHKRTFLYLEQLVLKHSLHRDTVSIKHRKEGIDFFFLQRSHATRFVDAVRGLVPVRSKTAEQLLSSDEQNATANMRYTYSVEIVPVCKDDLVCLSPAQLRFGLRGPLVLCTKVRTVVTILDPETLQSTELSAAQCFRETLDCIASSPAANNSGAGNNVYAGMTEFLVLDVEPTGCTNGRYVQALVTVRRDAGSGAEHCVLSHLGAVLKPGDTVRGYDVAASNANSSVLEAWRLRRTLQEIVLVQKVYQKRRFPTRPWYLEKLKIEDPEETQTAAAERVREQRACTEYERFLCDLEEDPEMRKNVAMFKTKHPDRMMIDGPSARAALSAGADEAEVELVDADSDEQEDDYAPEVPLEELMEALNINEPPS